jgi:hypothetical protein
MRLFEFYRQLRGLARPDHGDVERAGEAGARHAAYHKRVFLVGGAVGVLGLALGLLLVILWVAREGWSIQVVRGLPLVLTFGAYGFLLGMAVMCLVAPEDFLTGPVGRKWLEVVGARRILAVRIVCLISILAISAVPIAMCLVMLGF